MLTNLFRSDSGQGLSEYALILVLVALIVVAALSTVGSGIHTLFSKVVDEWPGN